MYASRCTLLIIHLREVSKNVTNVTISEKLTSLTPNLSQFLGNEVSKCAYASVNKFAQCVSVETLQFLTLREIKDVANKSLTL